MESAGKDTESVAIDIHEDDSAIYLFGSKLYCGWCLESFTCPVRLKIHCCVEHLAICSCGGQFSDKQSLYEHVSNSGCLLPPPFQWYHFLHLPVESNLNEVYVEEPEDEKRHELLDGEVTNEKASIKDVGERIQETNTECPPDRVKDRRGFWESNYATTTCTRSCPTCSRSFTVISKYIRHRAVCRAKRKRIQHADVDAGGRYSYLFNFCELAEDGRWKCKFCTQCLAHRGDLYKHIRAKHSEVQKIKPDGSTEMAPTANVVKILCELAPDKHIRAKHSEVQKIKPDGSTEMAPTANVVKIFCELAPDGRWKCKLCTLSTAYRCTMYKHIRTKHSEVQKIKPDGSTEMAPTANVVKIFCELAPDGRWKCKLCTLSTAYRCTMYKHIRTKHSDMWNVKRDASTELSPKANAVKNVTTSLKKDTEKSKAGKQSLFSCVLCPFQSPRKYDCKRHIKQMHGRKADEYMNWNRCSIALEKVEDCTTENNKDVIGTVWKATAMNELTLESAPAGKSDGDSTSLASSQSCYDTHRTDDVRFITSCVSSLVGGKPLSCQLCGGQFDGLEEAAVHLYNSHFSAVQQWRDTRTNVGEMQPLNENENGIDDKQDGSAACDQLEETRNAAACDTVANSETSECKDDMQLNISEHSLLKLEPKTSDNYVEPSDIHSTVQEVEREFTVDERNVLASTLCRLLDCHKAEPKAEVSEEQTVGVHNAESEGAVSESSPTKKTTASRSNSTKKTLNETKAVMQLISRKCKYCHRLCSNRFNCQRHEAVCVSNMMQSSKCRMKKSRIRSKHAAHSWSRVSTSVRAIYESNIFYCTKCGFSDSDHHVVDRHSKDSHVDANSRLKAHPGHDYIGDMKLTRGNYQCSLCGCHIHSRTEVLSHLHSHSSPVQMAGKNPVKPESPSDGVQIKTEENHSGLTTASHARSCPKCSRWFPSTSLYLRHRAICRVIQHNKVMKRRPRPRQYHFLINFCKLTPDGRWQCKLCDGTTAFRGGIYRHIRTRHGKLLNSKEDTE